MRQAPGSEESDSSAAVSRREEVRGARQQHFDVSDSDIGSKRGAIILAALLAAIILAALLAVAAKRTARSQEADFAMLSPS